MNTFDKERVVTLAVALSYDQVDAPRVSAKGQDEVAEQILQIAKRHNIPLQENKELVGLLSKVELGDHIPEALYLTVAEVIAFAYYLRGKVPNQSRPGTEG